MNEVDAGRDRAMPASFRHDDDEPLTPISSPAGGVVSDGGLHNAERRLISLCVCLVRGVSWVLTS